MEGNKVRFEATAQSGAVTSSGSADYFVSADGRHLPVSIVEHGHGKGSYGQCRSDDHNVVYGIRINWSRKSDGGYSLVTNEYRPTREGRYGKVIHLSKVPEAVLRFAWGAAGGASCYHCHCLIGHINQGENALEEPHSWEFAPDIEALQEEAMRENQ